MKFLLGWTMIVVLAAGLSAGAQDQTGTWQNVESKYFQIDFQNPADLVRLTSHLSRNESREAAQRIKRSGVVGQRDLGIYDRLYEQTMSLLGMRSRVKLSIRIYPSYGALESEYERLANRRDTVIAFYNPRLNVICVDYSADRTVLAHEMAHALADLLFVPNPPLEVQELLAGYVQSRI
jgi:hypothetical protein